MNDPDPLFRPVPGVAVEIATDLRRIVAPNPSPMTFRGTNTYLLGATELAVIDPGPDDPVHLDAILRAVLPGQKITHIIVTHAHLDHSPLARALSQATGAPVSAFGDCTAGRSEVMTRLARTGLMQGGEGVDDSFQPDLLLGEGDTIFGAGWSLEVIHTPGHFGNHISLGWGDHLFSGDLVMGWSTSLVSPPDGDLTDFMASCHKLLERPWVCFHPGHGAPVSDPADRTQWLITHRTKREREILTALQKGPANAQTLARFIYTDVPPALLPAATRNVLAHLVDLFGKSQVAPKNQLSADGEFQLV
jgi:glyoxylase-like metal-dependent hydrolase (beta-lactamase superfamily II)